ncbi:uncharacterized protein LOC143850475 [Tasmannia lanceolata]|uniref:uncharacterized protein LOC143850475 n=1 Tax=Tasmannia lanceolata TaxID=3420 RepID=UPI004064125E
MKTQEVEYDWRPRACSFCKEFGHTTERCNLNQPKVSQKQKSRREWVPKAVPDENAGSKEADIPQRLKKIQPSPPNCPATPHIPLPWPTDVEDKMNSPKDSESVPKKTSSSPLVNQKQPVASPNSPKATRNKKKNSQKAPLQQVTTIPPSPLDLQTTTPFQSPSTTSPSQSTQNPELVSSDDPEPVMIKPNYNLVVSPSSPQNVSLRAHSPQTYVQNESWQAHGDYSAVIKGHIWILWNPKIVDITILEESSQHIHTEVRMLRTNYCFNLTTIYAHNYYISRRALWSNLETLEPQINLPWLLTGDFNVVRFANERIGNTNHHLNEMEEFNECISNCDLSDLRSNNQSWTLHNRSSENRKLAKLDRSLVNDLWLHHFPLPFAEFLPPGISDHCPISISIEPHQSLGPKPFKFMNMWLEDQSIYPIVERAWSIKVKGNPMYQLCQKLKEVKAHLKEWNKDTFGWIDFSSPLTRFQLEETQRLLQSSPLDPSLIAQEDKLRTDYIKASNLEESLYQQKSKVQWLQLGDSNIRFFHLALKARQHLNSIMAIHRADNSQSTDQSEIANSFVQYFSRILNNGLDINKEKSEVFFAGTGRGTRRQISNALFIREGKLPIRYLGLPLISSRLSANDCTPLISKVRKKMQQWNCKNLSQACRIELVKSVSSTFHIYWASAFALLKGILHKLEQIFRDFIWGGLDSEKKFHSVNWNELCKPKNEGEVGIRKLDEISKALHIKLLWNLLNRSSSLWSRWVYKKYCKGRNIWTFPMPSKPSSLLLALAHSNHVQCKTH